MRIERQNILIAGMLLFITLLVCSSLSLHATENNKALQDCLDKADQELLRKFRALCLSGKKINGGTEQGKKNCYEVTVEEAIKYMKVSAFDRDVFDRILNQRKSDRDDCFKH